MPEMPEFTAQRRTSSRLHGPFYFDVSYIRSSYRCISFILSIPPQQRIQFFARSFVRNSPCDQPNLRLPHPISNQHVIVRTILYDVYVI